VRDTAAGGVTCRDVEQRADLALLSTLVLDSPPAILYFGQPLRILIFLVLIVLIKQYYTIQHSVCYLISRVLTRHSGLEVALVLHHIQPH